MILTEKGSQPKALDQPLPMVEPDANQHAQCTHLGILVGRRPCLKDLGPVGQLMQCAATAEEALHDLVDLTDPRPLIDTAVMIGLQILGELIGPHWPPVRVQLAYHKPADAAFYTRAFRCPVQFNASV